MKTLAGTIASALRQDDRDVIEALIDRFDVETVLDAIAMIMSEKADHIRQTWQDERLATLWDSGAGRVLHAATMVSPL